MKGIYFIQLLSFLFSTSCNESTTVNTHLVNFNNSTKQFKKEIRIYPNGQLDHFYTSSKEKQKLLGLDSIENGFDELQLRIWYDVVNVIEQKVVILTYSKEKWSGKLYYIIKPSKQKDVVPKSGWTAFANKLLNLKILTLPDGGNLSECGAGGGDGSTYNIELATKKHYRYYGYSEPQDYRGKCWQASNMNKILILLSTELNL